jgi:dTDP-4-dehydrorhamnose reductase
VRILLTGGNGQVGWELERALPALGAVIATDRAALDLADFDAIRRAVRKANPELIVNAAAYTAVDRAESEPGLAMRINGDAPRVLAEEAKRLGALLVHYSTDYVFDGTLDRPYREDDAPNPISVYGASKLAGEQAVRKSGCRHLIFRTSWVYGPRGNNFYRTIARAAREKPQLRVVSDQIGAPTSSGAIARATVRVLGLSLAAPSAESGTFHMTAGGETTWHGFAEAIVALEGLNTPVVAIRSDEYPTTARRPRNSRLDNARLHSTFAVALPEWRDGLAEVIERA